MSQKDLYRPNAAVIYQRPDGTILVCERVWPRGCWQFPQGGVSQGEDLLIAAQREGMEETGLRPNEYDMVACFGPYRYDYSEADRARVFQKRGIPYAGQEQHYFLFLLHDMRSEPWLDQKEFCNYRWIRPQDMDFDCVPDFKRPVYYQLMEEAFGVVASKDSSAT